MIAGGDGCPDPCSVSREGRSSGALCRFADLSLSFDGTFTGLPPHWREMHRYGVLSILAEFGPVLHECGHIGTLEGPTGRGRKWIKAKATSGDPPAHGCWLQPPRF